MKKLTRHDPVRRGRTARRALAFTALLGAACGCTAGEDGTVITAGDGDGDGGGGDGDGGQKPPGPYDTLSFTLADVEVDDLRYAAGFNGKLVRAADGTLYYAYLKQNSDTADCDIAIFAGGPAPAIAYSLKVARKAPADASWTVESVAVPGPSGQSFIAGRYGLDAGLDGAGRLIIATPGGDSGQFTCASSDLVVATRSTGGSWSFQTPVTGSGACCQVCAEPACCEDPACTQGTDAGYYPALAFDQSGNPAVAYVDAHFVTDEDGQNFLGFELWESAGVSGIRPWSGWGAYSTMRWVNGAPVVAFSSFNGGGLSVLRRTGTVGDGTDWNGTDLKPGWRIGERIQLEVAPSGKLGLAFFASQNGSGTTVDDLYYCESTDGGATWSQCAAVDNRTLRLGAFPSLSFDSQSRPAISYYFCGATAACESDGLRYAWRDDGGTWWTFDVHNVANNRSGFYTSLVIDPATDEPTIVFQDLTRGAAMVAYGKFGN